MEKYQDEPKSFSEATADEQVARFVEVRDLLKITSPFRDFINNAYKYPERFKIEGKSDEQKSKVFSDAAKRMTALSSALDLFKAIKVKETINTDKVSQELMGFYTDSRCFEFYDKEGKINVEQMVAAFRWSLDAYIAGVAVIGRELTLTTDKVPTLVDSIEYILKKINDYADLPESLRK